MILLEIGGFFLLISILLEGLKAAYKNKYSRSFVYTVSIVLVMVIFILTLDFVFSFWNERWLLFPALINSIKQLLTGTAYDYSDLLNFKLSFYGVLGTFYLVYMVFLIKASIVKGKKVVRLDPKKDIPLYMPIKEFSYVYSWLVLTTISVMTIFYSLVFDISSLDKQLFIGGATLLGIWELLLTIYFFEYFKQVRRYIFLLELLEKQNKISYIFQLIDSLLIKSSIILTKEELPKDKKNQRLFLLCIDYGIIEKSPIQENNGSLCISLSEEAEIFFQNKAAASNEGLIIGELNTYNETDTSK
ncbi:hypothetical protein [Enterococcus faecalis]|uniref:hypothetical protein n=1 Tax=Enterococcus faecalis TaxID=1351 RepID=UPI003B7B71C5|nr:hypothetical protein [Enterococcus faecalis]